VLVRLRRHRLIVFRDDRQLWSTPIAEGAAGTPTPRGRLFVAELLRQPDPRGAYGPWVFALSGFSRVLTRFHGGDGQLGIHGTNQPSLLGRNISHGCVRISNGAIERLARELPLGTPVDLAQS
jgi:lipoprotein-anchoring transpeptidase ErfK/SrfK